MSLKHLLTEQVENFNEGLSDLHTIVIRVHKKIWIRIDKFTRNIALKGSRLSQTALILLSIESPMVSALDNCHSLAKKYNANL